MYRFYKQKSAGKDVVYLLLEGDLFPDNVVNSDQATLLYNGGKLIGVNFFGGETSLLPHYGMNVVLEDEVLDAFNEVLVHCGADPLPRETSSGFVIGEVIAKEEHPLDEKKSILKISTGDKTYETISSFRVECGEKVAVALDGAYLSDGTLFKQHIDHNLRVDVLLLSASMLGIGEDKGVYKVPEGKNGCDLFIK